MLVLSVAWTVTTWTSPSTRTVGYGADSDAVVWCLGWWAHALLHGTDPLVSYAANAPGGVNLMWQGPMPLLATLLTPVTALAGPVVSYNVIATAAPALAAWAAFLAFRRWATPVAAFIGAVLFGFSPYTTVQTSQHAFLTFTMSAPLLLILLDRLLVTQRRRAVVDGTLLGLLAAAQLLTFEEVLAVEGVVAGIVVVVLGVACRRQVRPRLGHAVVGLATAAVVTLAVAAYPLVVQFTGPARVTRLSWPVTQYEADAWSFVTPHQPFALAPTAADHLASHFTGNWTEWDTYIGIPLLTFLVVAGVVVRRRLIARVGMLLVVVPGVLCMGARLHVAGRDTGIPMPWASAAALPVLRDLLPTRFGFVVFLGVGLLVALGVDALRHRQSLWRASAYLLLVAGVVAAAPQLPYHSQPAAAPKAFRDRSVCPAQRGGHVAVLPFQDYTLVWQAVSGFCYGTEDAVDFNVPWDASGTRLLLDAAGWDVTYRRPLPRVTPTLRRQIQTQVRRDRVLEVILGPTPPPARPTDRERLAAWLRNLFGKPPRTVGDVLVWDLLPTRLITARG